MKKSEVRFLRARARFLFFHIFLCFSHNRDMKKEKTERATKKRTEKNAKENLKSDGKVASPSKKGDKQSQNKQT